MFVAGRVACNYRMRGYVLSQKRQCFLEKKALFSAKESIALLESSSYAFRALQILLGGQFYKNFVYLTDLPYLWHGI